MAKYRFSKTIKPGQGIVIDAHGEVSEYKPEINGEKEHVIIESRLRQPHKHVQVKWNPRFRSSVHRKVPYLVKNPFDWEYPMPGPSAGQRRIQQSGSPCGGASRKRTAPTFLSPKRPAVTISMDDPRSPFYGMVRTIAPPEVRAGGGIFGVFAPKPVGRAAAMSFQKSHDELRR